MLVCGHTQPDKLLKLGFYKVTTEAVINNSHDDCHNTIIPTKHVVEVFILNTSTSGRFHGFLHQNNQIAHGLALHATLAPKAVESCSKAQKAQQVF